MTDEERRAPVQGEGTFNCRTPKDVPYGTISWAEHEEVWAGYHTQHPNYQTAELIALRGGFGYWEILKYLGRSPESWRPNNTTKYGDFVAPTERLR